MIQYTPRSDTGQRQVKNLAETWAEGHFHTSPADIRRLKGLSGNYNKSQTCMAHHHHSPFLSLFS